MVNSTALLATWEEPLDPNGVLTGYRLTVSIATDYLDPYNETFSLNSFQLFYVVSGLHPFATYMFELRAVTFEVGSATTAAAITDEDGMENAV